MNRARAKDLLNFFGNEFVILFVLSVLVGLLLSVVELAFAYGLQAFLVVAGIAPESNVSLLSWVPSKTLLQVSIFLTLASLFRGMLHWSQEYLRGSTHELFRFLQCSRLVRWTFRSRSVNSGYVTHLFNARINFAAEAVMGMQQSLLQGSMNVFLLTCMFWISVKMTLFTCVFGMLMMVPLRFINSNIRGIGEELAAEAQSVSNRLLMSIRNLLLLRIYNLQGREEELAQKGLGNYLNHSRTYFRTAAMILAIPQVLGTLLICGITWFMTHHHQVTGGVLLSFFYLFFRFSQNSTAMVTSTTRIVFRWEELKELYRWWLENVRDQDRSAVTMDSRNTPVGSLERPIGWKLDHVSYRYEHDGPWVLRNLSLEIPPGNALVVTGPSGAGKSTLMNLLLGELSPTQGKVYARLSGQDLEVEQGTSLLLNNIGYVGPESFLFDGTIVDNLCYGLQCQPNPARLESALLAAECQFVFDLPKKMEHRITEQGSGLSAGQKQRLALARALLRSPRALILDEATANLDVSTEARLISTLAKLKGEVTLVIITHRPALLTLADQHLDLANEAAAKTQA